MAELMVQLPNELNVEEMVAASWKAVLQVRAGRHNGCSRKRASLMSCVAVCCDAEHCLISRAPAEAADRGTAGRPDSCHENHEPEHHSPSVLHRACPPTAWLCRRCQGGGQAHHWCAAAAPCTALHTCQGSSPHMTTRAQPVCLSHRLSRTCRVCVLMQGQRRPTTGAAAWAGGMPITTTLPGPGGHAHSTHAWLPRACAPHQGGHGCKAIPWAVPLRRGGGGVPCMRAMQQACACWAGRGGSIVWCACCLPCRGSLDAPSTDAPLFSPRADDRGGFRASVDTAHRGSADLGGGGQLRARAGFRGLPDDA